MIIDGMSRIIFFFYIIGFNPRLRLLLVKKNSHISIDKLLSWIKGLKVTKKYVGKTTFFFAIFLHIILPFTKGTLSTSPCPKCYTATNTARKPVL